MGVKDGLKNIKDALFNGTGGEINHFWLVILFLFAIAAHVFDFFTDYDRGPGAVIIFYVVILIMAYFFVFNRQIGADEGALLVVIIISYLLPIACDLFTDSKFMIALSGLIFLIPLLPMYIAFKFPEHSFIKGFTKVYVAIWIIILAFYVITLMSPDIEAKSMIKNPAAGVKFVFAGVSNVFSKTFESIGNTIDHAVDAALGNPDPGTEESRVGIYVENVKPLESRYTNESEVFVEAKIVGVNLKESIEVSTMCFINGVQQGNTNPSRIGDVIGNYENIVECELGQLPTGTYTVRFQAVFEFEGSSDISYTFVDAELRSDQYERLDIDSKTIATYTGGPVALGLPSIQQPLRVHTDRSNEELYNYPFGISLENKWPQGKVSRGIGYILDTPPEVQLIDCNRNPTSQEEPYMDTGRNIYRFTMDGVRAAESFDAIRCRMHIEDINSLLISDKNVRTFAGRARYEYVVEGTTTLVIEKT